MKKTEFDIIGMTCSACQSHVQRAVEKLDGVVYVNVNLLSNSMTVSFNEKICSEIGIEEAVKKAGYEAIAKTSDKKNSTAQKQKKENSHMQLASLILSFVFLIVLMYFSMGNMMWDWYAPAVFDHHQNPMGFALIQFILLIPIVTLNFHYFKSGFKKLFALKPNMDSLIAVGSGVSILYGIFALFMISLAQSKLASVSSGVIVDVGYWQTVLSNYHDSIYFESAGMILTLVSLGKYLEGISKKKTTQAIEKLIDLAPKTAVILENGIEKTVDVSAVKVGDIVVALNGQAINSANDETTNLQLKQACLQGKVKLLYISPERLLGEINFLLRDIRISLFAIDEAHCISQWGHDFRPEYTQLKSLRKFFPDVPIVALTFSTLGRRFFLKSLRTMVISTLIIDLLLPLFPVYQGSRLLAAGFSGVLLGAGLSIIYMRGSSTGGADFLIHAAKRKAPHLSFGNISLAIDGVVILLGVPAFGDIDAALYGMVSAFALTIVMDKIIYGAGSGKLALVITNDGPAVAKAIDEAVERGSTLVDVTGSYSGMRRTMVMCACSNNEVFKVRLAAHQVDRGALVMICEANEVFGEGFRPPEVAQR